MARPLLLTLCLGLLGAPVACGGSNDPAKEPLPPLDPELLEPAAPSASADAPGASTGGGGVQSAVPPLRSTDDGELDSFAEDVEKVRWQLGKWEKGSGAVLRLSRDGTHDRVSLIYTNPDPPVFVSDAKRWMIEVVAHGEGDVVLGHFVLLLERLRPGKTRGKKGLADVAMSISFRDGWSGKDDDTGWSINGDAWCELELERGAAETTFEGTFRGLLVSNDASTQTRIDSGYIYIKP